MNTKCRLAIQIILTLALCALWFYGGYCVGYASHQPSMEISSDTYNSTVDIHYYEGPVGVTLATNNRFVNETGVVRYHIVLK